MVCRKKIDDCLSTAEFSVLMDVDVTPLFYNEDGSFQNNINWQFCQQYAVFEHTSEYEYILHIGDGRDNNQLSDSIIEDMKEFGCTPEFIELYKEARRKGAMRLMLHFT